MAKRGFPKAATSAERSKASRLRRKAAREGSLRRHERAWLRSYDSDRKRLAKGVGKPPKATPDEARQGRRLRARKKAGKRLTLSEQSELKAFNQAQARRRRPSRAKRRSAMYYAIQIRDIITDWSNGATEADYDERWYMKPRPGRPGVAIANSEWPNPAMPNVDSNGDIIEIAPGDFPASSGHLANVKVRWAFFDDNGDEKRAQWLSIVQMTSDWATIPNDLATGLEDNERPSLKTREGESIAALTGISIYVTPPRK